LKILFWAILWPEIQYGRHFLAVFQQSNGPKAKF